MRYAFRTLCLFAGLIVLLPSCSKPQATPVTGTVYLAGTPAADLQVTFTGTVNGKEVTASGNSDSSGKFTLAVSAADDKVPVGKYRVTVIDRKALGEEEPKTGFEKRPVSRVPSTYAVVSSTPIEVMVEAGKSDYEVRVEVRK